MRNRLVAPTIEGALTLQPHTPITSTQDKTQQHKARQCTARHRTTHAHFHAAILTLPCAPTQSQRTSRSKATVARTEVITRSGPLPCPLPLPCALRVAMASSVRHQGAQASCHSHHTQAYTFCAHLCTRTTKHTCALAFSHPQTNTHTHTHTHTNKHTNTHTNTRTNTHAHML